MKTITLSFLTTLFLVLTGCDSAHKSTLDPSACRQHCYSIGLAMDYDQSKITNTCRCAVDKDT